VAPGRPSRERMISIIIITKDTALLLRDLLSSIERDQTLTPVLREVIVVDNASSDGTDQMVREHFSHVTFIRQTENLGFAASANRGLCAASGDYCLLLNSDTLLIEGEVAKMVRYMEEHPDVALCGPRLVYGDRTLQRSFAAIPSLSSEIVPGTLLEHLRRPGRGGVVLRSQAPVDVESLIGAAILIRKKVLEALSGFDEGFFFFLEETDLAVRARKARYRVVFFPEAEVIHLQGQTVKKNWVGGRIEYSISLYRFIKKHHGDFYFRVFAGVRFVKSLLFLLVVLALPFLLLGRRVRRSFTYYYRLALWHLKGCPSTGGLKGSG
jgi:N-acetylglucosaminyl-diphospho-decaprenol L-rhamnosyltransferase